MRDKILVCKKVPPISGGTSSIEKSLSNPFTVGNRYRICGNWIRGNSGKVWYIDNEDIAEHFTEVPPTSPIKDEENRIAHPEYYTAHPSGIECIDIARHYIFDIGCAIKYLWRAGLKTEEGLTSKEKEIEDLKKAIWYIEDRISTLQKELEKQV